MPSNATQPTATAPVVITAPAAVNGMRADKALTELLTAHMSAANPPAEYSRATIQRWCRRGYVQVDGKVPRPKDKLRGGEIIRARIPEPAIAAWPAQPIALEVIFADADLLVINKPAGLVVHPGAGQKDQTLLNGLLHWDDALRALPRAGIVHRLDKDTTGLMAVARTESARRSLIAQLQTREFARGYLAVAHGVPVAGECIEQPIGRHRFDRLRMCVTPRGKPAATRLFVRQKYRKHCRLRAELLSGRTHQIRVHLSWRGFPLVGDKLYGGRRPATAAGPLADTLRQFNRQALHAETLALRHPTTGAQMQWRQPPPDDLRNLITQLELDAAAHAQ